MQVFHRVAVGLLAALLVVSAPTQAQLQNPDESTETTLYFHIFDTFNRFFVNTQPMNADFFKVGGTNNPTTPPIPELAPNGMDYNTIYGVSTAGPVEYDFIENGLPRFHPERGIAKDVLLDPAVTPVAYIYLDLRDVFGTDGFPSALPDFHVRVTMKEGDDPGRDAQLDDGELIMQGDVDLHAIDLSVSPGTFVNGFYDFWAYTIGLPDAPDAPNNTVSGNDPFEGQPGPDGDPVLIPDASGVIEIPVPMTNMAQNIISKADAFNIRLDWWMLEDVFGEDAFSTSYFRFVADQDHLPRLEMSIMNPVYIEFIHPQVAAGTLLIHSGVNSPWGTYDVDVENITVSINGPATPQQLDQVIAQNQHVHNLHDKAAEITYLWDFRGEDAPNGDYTITMSVPNMAGTAVATGTAGFTIEGKKAFGVADTGDVVPDTNLGDASEDSPAFGVLGALALLGAAFFVSRRNRL